MTTKRSLVVVMALVAGLVFPGAAMGTLYDLTLSHDYTGITPTTVLGEARRVLAATTLTVGGNTVALFGGGNTGSSSYSNNVDYYNPATGVWTSDVDDLVEARGQLAATGVSGYALFGGGNPSTATLNAYNGTSWTKYSTGSTALSVSRYGLAATSVGGKALFGGGYAGSYSTRVDIYDASLGRTTGSLSVGRSNLAATSVSGFALFAGGTTGSLSVVVDAYDSATGQIAAITPLSTARYYLAAATANNMAFFGGGSVGGATNAVDIYWRNGSSWGHDSTKTLSQGRLKLAATTLGNRYVLFGGGQAPAISNRVDIYDAVLGDWVQPSPGNYWELSVARAELSATSVSYVKAVGGVNHQFYEAIFAGGTPTGAAADVSNVVDIFKWDAGPLAPVLLLPGAGATVTSLTPTFTWTEITGATYYGLYIAKASDGSLVYQNNALAGTSTSFNLPSGNLTWLTGYTWKMRTYDGAWGEYGGAWSFTTSAEPPVVVPEPAGLGLVGMALLALRRRRK